MSDPDTISADYTLRPSELAETLALLIEARQPCVVWGPPGSAKSQIARQVAAEAGRHYVDVRALLLDPVDLRGIPWRDGSDRTRWAPPSFLPPTDDPGRFLINLEELPSAVPMVQAALYQLVLDRKVGEYALPEGASLIACGIRDVADSVRVDRIRRQKADLEDILVHVHKETPEQARFRAGLTNPQERDTILADYEAMDRKPLFTPWQVAVSEALRDGGGGEGDRGMASAQPAPSMPRRGEDPHPSGGLPDGLEQIVHRRARPQMRMMLDRVAAGVGAWGLVGWGRRLDCLPGKRARRLGVEIPRGRFSLGSLPLGDGRSGERTEHPVRRSRVEAHQRQAGLHRSAVVAPQPQRRFHRLGRDRGSLLRRRHRLLGPDRTGEGPR